MENFKYIENSWFFNQPFTQEEEEALLLVDDLSEKELLTEQITSEHESEVSEAQLNILNHIVENNRPCEKSILFSGALCFINDKFKGSLIYKQNMQYKTVIL